MHKILVLPILYLLMLGCEHDPFPAPPVINNPIDTSGNPVDTSFNTKPCDPDSVYFARDILPILSSSCAYSGCHDAATASDDVILDNFFNTVTTADVRPGDPEGSDLYEKITDGDPDDRMPPPPNNPLSNNDISLIRKWINQGAKNLSCDDCDTTAVSFKNDIEDIFYTSCVSCHSGNTPDGGLSLTTYMEIKNAIQNNVVIQRINHEAGYSPMPPSGIKLDPCKLLQINQWVQDGYPNN